MNLVHEGVLDPNEPDFRDEKREAEEARRERESLSVDELADKVREIAAIIHTDEFHEESHDLELIADEIKAAWKREVVSETETTTVGNASAMYDALVKIAHYCDDKNGMDDPYCADGHILSDIARAALSAPARQCDVGTPEEQEKRFCAFCATYRYCGGCPHIGFEECALAWAQTPYEAEEGAGK